MKVAWIGIKGFRNFSNTVINFSEKSLIIGANDIGKSNLLYALRIIFDRSLSEKDLDLFESDYNSHSNADKIEITVCVSNIQEDCLKSIFKGKIKDDCTFIRYVNTKNSNYEIMTGPTLDLLELENKGRFYLKRLSLEYVDTNRDLHSFVRQQRIKLLQNSKKLLSEIEDNDDNSTVKQLQNELDQLNEKVDNLNYIKKALGTVNCELGKMSAQNEGRKIHFVAGSSDINKLLDNLTLAYSEDGNSLSLGGDGFNNQIFIATWASKHIIERSINNVVMFAIEEPEAHLHPHQQRRLSKYLLEIFDEQVFLTSHSPYIASQFRPDKVVRLCKKNNSSEAAQCGCSTTLQSVFNDFGYRLNAITAESFFSNGVFLVEGVSERLFYSAIAQEIDIDLDRLNISIISVEGVGFKPYIKIFEKLGIPYTLRTDNDKASKIVSGVKKEYFSGISRAVGIYKELKDLLVTEVTSDELLCFWEEHNNDNEWDYGQKIPEESLVLNNEIQIKLKKHNIFLAEDCLEQDILNSPLRKILEEFYKLDDSCKLLDKMQKKKAENMLSFIESNQTKLKLLKNHQIIEPLKRIVDCVHERVVSHEKSN